VIAHDWFYFNWMCGGNKGSKNRAKPCWAPTPNLKFQL
jgi:hypothetical protein